MVFYHNSFDMSSFMSKKGDLHINPPYIMSERIERAFFTTTAYVHGKSGKSVLSVLLPLPENN